MRNFVRLGTAPLVTTAPVAHLVRQSFGTTTAPAAAAAPSPFTVPIFTSLTLSSPAPGVIRVALNRPHRLNALTRTAFTEIHEAFEWIDTSSTTRAVLISGEGKHFCAGIDLETLGDLKRSIHDPSDLNADAATRARALARVIRQLQVEINAPARCRLPVIVVSHGEALGAGLALLCAADIRVAAGGGGIQVTEPRLGFACDLGTLQRITKQVASASWTMEMCLTARRVTVEEAFEKGFFSALHPTLAAADAAALAIAVQCAKLPPAAVEDTKRQLVLAYDGVRIADGLDLITLTNAAALQGNQIGGKKIK